jgi:hypothetical protein
VKRKLTLPDVRLTRRVPWNHNGETSYWYESLRQSGPSVTDYSGTGPVALLAAPLLRCAASYARNTGICGNNLTACWPTKRSNQLALAPVSRPPENMDVLPERTTQVRPQS